MNENMNGAPASIGDNQPPSDQFAELLGRADAISASLDKWSAADNPSAEATVNLAAMINAALHASETLAKAEKAPLDAELKVIRKQFADITEPLAEGKRKLISWLTAELTARGDEIRTELNQTASLTRRQTVEIVDRGSLIPAQVFRAMTDDEIAKVLRRILKENPKVQIPGARISEKSTAVVR